MAGHHDAGSKICTGQNFQPVRYDDVNRSVTIEAIVSRVRRIQVVVLPPLPFSNRGLAIGAGEQNRDAPHLRAAASFDRAYPAAMRNP
jgi:hypothetical protein